MTGVYVDVVTVSAWKKNAGAVCVLTVFCAPVAICKVVCGAGARNTLLIGACKTLPELVPELG